MRSSGPCSTVRVRAGVDALDVLQRHRVHHVDLAGEQRGDARRVDLIVVKITSSRLCSGLPHQFGFGLNTVFTPGWWLVEHERAGAVGVERRMARAEVGVRPAAAPRRSLSAHFLDKMYQVSHSACRIGFGAGSTKSTVWSSTFTALMSAGTRALDVASRGAHALGREHHVVGGEILAVVELDALAQVEAPARRLDDLPALGQAGNDLQVLVALGQPLIDVAEQRRA